MVGTASAGSNPPPFGIRVAGLAELDTLCEIDLDAAALFTKAGLALVLPDDHPFSIMERVRWLRSLATGRVLLAVGASGTAVGFAASGVLDGEPYLDQLSVRTSSMRVGIGAALLRAAEGVARDGGARALWLTTYSHLPWNRPFYERAGFTVASPPQCGPEVLEELAFQQRWLPLPEERIVMKKVLPGCRPP